MGSWTGTLLLLLFLPTAHLYTHCVLRVSVCTNTNASRPSATLENLVPSALYISSQTQGRVSIPEIRVESASVDEEGSNRVEGERAPLLDSTVYRKYT